MLSAPIPTDESNRLSELDRLEAMYSKPEAVFDRVTAQIAEVFDAPAAMMNLIDRDTQYILSAAGFPPEALGTRTVPRNVSLCGHVVGTNQPLVVEDLANDERFRDNPVVKQHGLRFYAGAPLRTDSGEAIGTLCVVDVKPRKISEREQKLLRVVADGLMAEMKLRVASRQLVARTRAMQHDLYSARIVQRFLLPPGRQETETFALCHHYHPVEAIGGDFLDVHLRSDGSLAILVADVSGHGASAALTSAMVKTTFGRAALGADGPAQVLSDVHRDMSAATETTQFITAVAAIYAPAEQIVTLASAGHPYPILLRRGAASVVEIVNDLPLLIEPGHEYRRQTRTAVRSGDRIIFYTDGATEAVDGDHPDNMLEMSGLVKLIDAHANLTGEQFLPALFEAVRVYAHGQLRDDVALVCLEVK